MKRRRHLLAGLLLIAAALVFAVADAAALDPWIVVPVAAIVGLAGVANVVIGIGRPAAVRARSDAVETATFLAFALLGLAVAVENGLAPDDLASYVHATLWGLTAVVFGWLGIDRLRSRA